MAVVGGLRERLIHDSCYKMVNEALTALGWFTAGRAHRPVTFLPQPVDNDEAPAVNSIALAPQGVSGVEAEMGSGLEENTHTYYLDVYAEDDSVGLHLSGDLKDILRGKFPSIGRTGPNLAVLDLRLFPVPATPLFYCEIQEVLRDKAPASSKLHLQHWYAVRFELVDTYDDEGDS